MAETVRSLFLKARALLDELTDDGVLIPEAEVIDMQEKSILLADLAQKELHKIGKLYNTFEFTNKPAPNLLGLFSNFEIIDFIGTPQYYPNSTGIAGAKAYYFEADGEGTVKIEENQSGVWTALTTIAIPSSVTSPTAYKGLITPLSSTNLIRLTFDGTTHYRHVNRALFSYPFALAKIPSYRPWVRTQMPSNFQSRDQIIEETATRQYTQSVAYKWEGWKDLYINYYFEGNIRVVYKPVPTALTDIDDVLEIDDITAQGVAYYIAAKLAPFENKELVNFFEGKFGELKLENTRSQPATEEQIIDVYSGVWGGGS
jgi:hypothetical protein